MSRTKRALRRIGVATAVGVTAWMALGVRSAAAQGYSQVSNTSGAASVNGVTLIASSGGGAGSFSPCGSSTGPYFLGSMGSSYTFAFAVPVGSVQVQPVFAASGTAGALSFEVDGSDYPITAANVAGPAVGSSCSPGVAAIAADGVLTNTGNEALDPNALVLIPGPVSTVTISNTGTTAAAFGLFFSPDSYFQVTNTAGAVAVNGITTTVTASGSAGTFSPCGAIAGPYYVGGTPGQYLFQFSQPVDGVNVAAVFAASATAGAVHFAVDGSAVSLTTTNLAGPAPGSTCSPGLAAVLSGGDLSNAGNTALDPNGLVQMSGPIDTLAVSSAASAGFVHGLFIAAGPAAALAFSNAGNQSLMVPQDALATSIDSMLASVDKNAGLTLTWDVAVAPTHGTLGGFPTTASATGSVVTPTSLTYTPSPGYVGSDGFAVLAYDGVNTVAVVVDVTIAPPTTTTSSTTTSTSTSSTSTSTTSTSTSTTTTTTSTSSSTSSSTTSTSTSTSSSTSSTSTTSTTSTVGATTTTSTTGVPPPACGVGAGLPRPPKPPRHSGLVKIVKGLTATPAAKSTKWTVTGTLDGCLGFPIAPNTGTPIASGSLALRVKFPPGSTCSILAPGAPVKVRMVVAWNALVNGTPKIVAKDRFQALASFSSSGNGITAELHIATPDIVNPKSLLVGRHLVATLVMDETQPALDAACAGPGGISRLHFTGMQGMSTLTLLP